MIKLTRSPKPSQLTCDLQTELTNKYISTGDSVWNKEYIKKALLGMSNNKCCYCECDVSEESKYMEVEHYYPKSIFPKKVLEWDNLLPSCKRCNGQKSNHDTSSDPIINPVSNIPSEHLFIRNYLLYGKDDLGKKTIGVLYLNDFDRLVKSRFDIGITIQESTENLAEKAKDYELGIKNSITDKNKIIGGTKTLLREASPDKQYSATAATILLTEPNYLSLKSILERIGFWNDELNRLENIAKENAFSIT